MSKTLGIVGVVVVLIVWCVNLSVPYWGITADFGQYGDVFGASNALFAGLAFAGVFYSVLLQRKEVSLAKEELQRTKAILLEQQTNLAQQNAAMERSERKDTFYQLLRNLSDIVNNIDLQGRPRSYGGSAVSGEITRGKDALRVFVNRLVSEVKGRDVVENSSDVEFGVVRGAYDRLFQAYGDEYSHYLRMLYAILAFVDDMALEDQRFHAKILRAQLTAAESVLILAHCVLREGNEKFIRLICKYGMLKYVDTKIIITETLARQISAEAFGRAYAAKKSTTA